MHSETAKRALCVCSQLNIADFKSGKTQIRIVCTHKACRNLGAGVKSGGAGVKSGTFDLVLNLRDWPDELAFGQRSIAQVKRDTTPSASSSADSAAPKLIIKPWSTKVHADRSALKTLVDAHWTKQCDSCSGGWQELCGWWK